MQALGELIDNSILVKKSKDIGRLYNKSHFGTLISNDQLQLDVIESIYLLGEEKIRIFDKKNELKFQDLVKIAEQNISDFEIKYLVLKDLRNRGYPIKLSKGEKLATFYKFQQRKNSDSQEKQCFISSFSERDFLDLENTINLIKKIKNKNGKLWYSIVDDEGDITYYDVDTFEITGDIKEHIFTKSEGFLLKNRIVIFDEKLSNDLIKKEFFGKPFGNGLQLSIVESLYLLEKDVIDVQNINGKKISKIQLINIIKKLQPDIESRFLIFKDLKKRRFIVKTGFKYGAHFRVYTKQIDKGHSEYLIHVVDKEFKGTWAEMSRAVRLAHSVNKEFVFARVDGDKIDYIKLGRLRP
jgi:tRNA-intron endonuclease